MSVSVGFVNNLTSVFEESWDFVCRYPIIPIVGGSLVLAHIGYKYLSKAYSVLPNTTYPNNTQVQRIDDILSARPFGILFYREEVKKMSQSKISFWAKKVLREDPELMRFLPGENLVAAIAKSQLLPDVKYQFAKELLKKSSKSSDSMALRCLCHNLEKFQFSPKQHQEIGEELVKCDPISVALDIKKFQFSSEQRNYIFERYIMTHTQYLSLIDDFQFSSEKLAECAEKIYFKDQHSFLQNLERFHLSPQKLEEYAEKIYLQDPNLFLQNLERFRLSPEKLHEFAGKLYDKDPRQLLLNLGRFLSTEEIRRFAERLLKTNPEILSKYLREFEEHLDSKTLSSHLDSLIKRSLGYLIHFDSSITDRLLLQIIQTLSSEGIDVTLVNQLISVVLINIRDEAFYDLFFNPYLCLFSMFYQSFLVSSPLHFSELMLKYHIQTQKGANTIQIANKVFDHSRYRLVYFLIYFMNIPLEVKERFIENFNKHQRLFRNEINLRTLVFLLKDIATLDSSLTGQRENLLMQIFQEGSQINLKQRMSILNAMIHLKMIDMIPNNKIISFEDLTKLFTSVILKAFNLEIGEKIVLVFSEKILMKFRDPMAIMVYLSKIVQLESPDREYMLKVYREFFLSIIEGVYDDFRFRNDPHLLKLKELGVDESLLRKWAYNNLQKFFSLDDFSSEKLKPKNERFKDFLSDRLIQNSHILNLETRFPNLFDFLTAKCSIDESIENLKKKSEGNEKSKEKDFIIEQQLLLCVKDPTYDYSKLQALVKDDDSLSVFNNDLNEFTVSSREDQNSLQNRLCFEISSDPSDLLLLGRETGGCQNIDNNPSLNKCLLGYVFGKNRLLTIKDPNNGRMIARCISRLLWSETANRPVMFIEKVYSLNTDPRLAKALFSFAKDVATDIGVPLVLSNDFSYGNCKVAPLNENLVSFGSYAPYEYSDSAKGITSGIYSCSGMIPIE